MSKNNKPTLWIVTELFYPDQTSTSYILSKIADKMSQKYKVNVITTSDLYQDNIETTPFFIINEEIHIIRVTSNKLDKNKLGQRLLRMIRLTDLLFNELKKRIKKNDKLLIPTNPAPLLLRCAKLRKKFDFEFSILVHDVFPENTIPAGIFSSKDSLIFKYLSQIFNKGYSRADKLIVLGRDMRDVVSNKLHKNRHPSVTIIENWGDVEMIRPSEEIKEKLKERHQKGEITIQYAGNIGRVQGLDFFIDIILEAKNEKVCFDLYGEGALKEILKQKVKDSSLEKQIHFYGSYSRNDQNEILNNADIALVTLAEGMYGLGVPSKTYNILAAGKPILFIGDTESEIGRLVKEENIGFVFEAKEQKEILEFLSGINSTCLPELSEMGKNARLLAEEKFSEDIILDKFLHTI